MKRPLVPTFHLLSYPAFYLAFYLYFFLGRTFSHYIHRGLRDQKKTNKDQKKNRGIKKKQIRIKKTNKDDRSENRPETAEREDQKKTTGNTYE